MAHALRRASLTAATASVIVTLPSLFAGLGAPALAIPQLDLKPYPAAAAGQTRWVIQLPGVLPPGTDPRLSPHPSDWRVQLIPGRQVEADCNQQAFRGRFRASKLKGLGVSVYTVSDVGPTVSTRMACPPGQAKRKVFVPMGSKPFVVPYDASRPIVVYTPKDLQLRWRLWKAEKVQQPAQAL
ncbi:ecotin family protein [Synechococcus sp. CS-1332]|uniref:ecotin family protein n=1 Tax=Synechococcus sp. CS-1332 TaxID=2847972 RepID=UPI00223B4F9B|nr:ecotin family protein [Synechococcus sp. CS-1332]MCT0207258.1 ecotin family protein [Synechococcus sp. CS-1332]